MLQEETGGEIPAGCERLADLISFSNKLHKVTARGIEAALHNCPKCHFPMLERLHFVIKKYGDNGKIYVGALITHLNEAPPAVSRTLRMLEGEGLIMRETDPADRRKTTVRISEKGDAARRQCEAAVGTFLQNAMQNLGEEHMHELMEQARCLVEAMEAETERMNTEKKEGKGQL